MSSSLCPPKYVISHYVRYNLLSSPPRSSGSVFGTDSNSFLPRPLLYCRLDSKFLTQPNRSTTKPPSPQDHLSCSSRFKTSLLRTTFHVVTYYVPRGNVLRSLSQCDPVNHPSLSSTLTVPLFVHGVVLNRGHCGFLEPETQDVPSRSPLLFY